MKDKLEQFIRDNRESFDIHEPDTMIWKKIEKNIRPKRRINWYSIMNKAAVILVVFFASYFAQRFLLQKEMYSLVGQSYKDKIPELQEAESYYSGLLDEKFNEVKPYLTENPGLEKEIKRDLSELDSMYNGLEKDLRDNIATEEVIEAMIENYRLRLTILEEIISELSPEEEVHKPKNYGYEL